MGAAAHLAGAERWDLLQSGDAKLRRCNTPVALLPCSPAHPAAAELADDDVELEPAPRRALRSTGPVAAPPPQASAPGSRGPASRAGSEPPAAPAAVAAVAAKASNRPVLPNPKDVRREHT